ncbi:glycoside hydrolase family 35 protein [Alloiococcus otitis]|uniref:glycoside hydrolase family 35 protein n=1 Tax=Alloiococcus otitis TaxID=1652 RepID=UPI002354C009|nr:beta-galactosidase family protein [Alloiococcus otitis]
MTDFQIKDKFYLDGEPFKFLSGAIHYFRIPRADWHHSLYNLKALGFNTVETYVPWNAHEPEPGHFDFSGNLDVKAFIKEAEELGLYVILRPSPYICAEWEYGGLPGWIINEDLHPRSSDPAFLELVDKFFARLFKEVGDLQFTHGGPILMMQIENEYGSYGEDKDYLKGVYDSMKAHGADVPLCTSDGAWLATLRAGTLTDIDEDILITGNFGSKAKENFGNLKDFHDKIGKEWPLMVMEFWCGWFNRWGEPIVTRETDELVEALREAVQLGSVNLYMFQGGTNFGFMNGCSARGTHDLHQITSYDYGAPLDEQGNPTEKYYAIQKMIKEEFPDIDQAEPLVKESTGQENVQLEGKVNLVDSLDQVADRVDSLYTRSMDELGQHYGYILYQTDFVKDVDEEERLRVIDGRDRAHVFLNDQHLATQYQEEIGEDITTGPLEESNKLDILVENMGRVNYGHKLLADTQEKGIRQGVTSDLHFLTNWRQYLIDFDRVDQIDYSLEKDFKEGLPSFYKFNVTFDDLEDTYIDLSDFGKGIVLVNGHNLGRFWDLGPTLSLYLPKAFLKEGVNEVTIFETEGKYAPTLSFKANHVYKKMKED